MDYFAEGKVDASGGAAIEFTMQFRTDSEGRIQDFQCSAPGKPPLEEIEITALADRIVVQLMRLQDGQVYISESKDHHFAEIVPRMDRLGASRCGSKNVEVEGNVMVLVDIYDMPNGRTILAGYQNDEATRMLRQGRGR
jgi:hypothetical protein